MAQSSQNITPAMATRLAEEQVKKVLREMSGGRNSAMKAALDKILKVYKDEMSKLEADIQKNEKETAADQKTIANRLAFLQQEKIEGRTSLDAYEQEKERIEKEFAETQSKRQQEISHRRINIVTAFRSNVEFLFGIDQYIAAGAELDNAAAVMQMNNLGDLAEMLRESKKANLALIEKHRKEAAKAMESVGKKVEKFFSSQTSQALEGILQEQTKSIQKIAEESGNAYVKADDDLKALVKDLKAKQERLKSLKKIDYDSAFQLSYGAFGSSAGLDAEDYEINDSLRKDEIGKLEEDVSVIRSLIKDAKKDVDSHRDKNEAAEQELKDKRKKLKDLLDLYNPLIERQKNARLKELEAKSALMKLDGDLQDSRRELAELDLRLKTMQTVGDEKRTKEIEKAVDAAKKRIALTEKSIQSKKAELADTQAEIEKQDKEFSGLADQFKGVGINIKNVSGEAKIELESAEESIQEKGSNAVSKTAESVSGIKAADSSRSSRGVMKQKLVAGTLDQIKNDTKLGRLLKGALAAKKGMARRGILGAAGGLAGSIGNDIHKSIRDWKNSGGLGKKIAGGILDFGISAVRHFNANRKFKKADKTASELGLTLEQIKPAVERSKTENLLNGERHAKEFLKFQDAVEGIRNAIEMRRQEDILNIETFGRFGMDVDGDRVEYDEKSLDAVRQQWAKQLKKGQLNTDKVYSDVPKLKKRLHRWIDAEFGKAARKNAVKGAKIANAGALGKLLNSVRAYASGSTSEEDRKRMREAAGEKIKSKGMDVGRRGLAALKNAIFGKREDVVDKYADLAVVSHAKGGTWKAAMSLAKKAAGGAASMARSGTKKVMRVLGAKKENELFSVDKKGTVTVLPSEGTGVTEVTKGSGSASKGPGSLAAPKGETAQEMADRQKAAESQQNIARNVETIVRLLEEDAKLKREKKKESFWGKLLGFLGLLVGSFIPKILGMLKLLWKVGKLVGKVLKPIFKILMKVAGPLLRFLGMFGKLLAGGIAGLGKALLAGASGLFGAAKSGLKKLREKFGGKGAEAGKGKAGKAGEAGKGKAGEAGKGKTKTRRLGGGRNVNARGASKVGGAGKLGGASKLGAAGKILGRAAGPIAALFAAKDAYDAWNDEDLHKRAFGLKEGEKASTGQKIQAGMAGAGAGIINIGSGAVGLLGAGTRKLGETFGIDLSGVADTLDGLAEKIRIDPATLIKAYNAPLKTLGETITNMTDGIPILGDVVKGIGGFIESSPMLKGAVEWLDQHNPLKMITEGLGKTIDWLGSDHKWEDIKAGFAGLGSWVSEKASAAWEGVKSGFASAGEWMSEKASKAWEFVKENNPISLTVKGMKMLGAKIVEIAPKAWEFIKEYNPVSLTVKGFKMLGEKIVELAPKAWEFIKEYNPISLTVKGLTSLGEKLGEVLSKAWEGIKSGFSAAGEWMSEKASKAWEGMKGGLESAGEWMSEKASKGWELIKEHNPFAGISDGLSGMKDKFKDMAGEVWQSIKENNPFTAIMSGIESIRKWFDSFSLVDWVKRKFGFGEEDKKEESQPGQPAKEEKKEERPSWLPAWIPSFGEGGIVKSTKAGTLALVAENGEDEAVMPMSKLARFVLESFKLGQEGLAGSAGGMKSVGKETFGERLVRFFKNLFGMGESFGAEGDSPANKPIAGFTFELLKTVKDIRDNIELITKMVKLIKVDGTTLGELVEQGTPMPAGVPGVPGTAGPGAGAPAAGAPAAGQRGEGAPVAGESGPSGNAAPFAGGQKAAGVSGKYGAITGWRDELVLAKNQRALNAQGKHMDWSQATNNPGNVGNTDQGRTNIFPDLQSGIKAQAELLKKRYSGMTLLRMAQKYTPTKWQTAIKTWKESGIREDEIPNLEDPAVMARLLKSIHKAEGSSNWVPTEEVDYALGLKQMPEGYQKKDYRQLTEKGKALLGQAPAAQGAGPTIAPAQGGAGGPAYVDIARQWAATDQGYDQGKRGAKGHFDCSSLVYRSTKAAGVKWKVGLDSFTTAQMNPYDSGKKVQNGKAMRDAGFQWVKGTEGMKAGDILWKNGHTVIYSGNGNIIGAHGIKKYKQSGKMQDLLDSVSEKRLGDRGTYAGYWRYVGGDLAQSPAAAAPAAAPSLAPMAPAPAAPSLAQKTQPIANSQPPMPAAAPRPSPAPAAPGGMQMLNLPKSNLPLERRETLSAKKQQVANLVIAEAKRQGVDPRLALALANQESRFDQKDVSHAGAVGVMQLMKCDVAAYGGGDRYNVNDNIRMGVTQLKKKLDLAHGDVREALLRYNWGDGNFNKWKKGLRKDMPKEARQYADRVLGHIDNGTVGGILAAAGESTMNQVPAAQSQPGIVPPTSVPLYNPDGGGIMPQPSQGQDQASSRIPGMQGGPVKGLSSIYANLTAGAINRRVGYLMGGKNSSRGHIDCSGWVSEMNRKAMEGMTDPTAKANIKKVLAGGSAAGLIQAGLGFKGAQVTNFDPSQIKENTMIGLAIGKHARGRFKNIGHVVQTYRDPETGEMMVSESTSRSRIGGRSGVIKTKYSDWYAKHKNVGLYGVDMNVVAGGAEFDPNAVKDSMADAQQPQYGVGATEQSSPQIQASQQGQAAEAAQAYYAGGGAGGQAPVDASTNIMGGGNGKQGSPIELVVNKDPMGWIRLQGNAVH